MADRDQLEIIARSGRRKSKPRIKDPVPKPHFIDADLREIVLSEAELEGAEMERANLRQANLRKANLRRANLRNANLQRTRLENAKLEGAVLDGVHAEAGNFRNSRLRETSLRNAHLECANFENTSMCGARLENAYLFRANLKSANLKRARLNYAKLEGANLKGVNFTKANLSNANLRKSNLAGANFKGAILDGAILNGANIEGAKFIRARMNNAEFDNRTAYLPRWWQLLFSKRHKDLYRLLFQKSNFTNFHGSNIDDANTNKAPLLYRYAKDQQYLASFRERYPALYTTWKIFSDCGGSVSVVLFWALVCVLTFATLYGTLPWSSPSWLPQWWIGIWTMNGPPINLDYLAGDPHTLTRLWKTMFVSFDVFSNLGLRDTLPHNPIGAVLMVAESVLGVVAFGMLISVLLNRFAKRS